ncbi:MAG: hypothetical protein H7831_09255 [Magnetococcus sp. WYHC-3]
MTIRRIDKGHPLAGGAAARRTAPAAGGGENFAHMLDSVAGVGASEEVSAPPTVESVGAVGDEPGRRERRVQRARTGELLDTLEDLERDLVGPLARETDEGVRQRLRETRDNALRTLSETPRKGEERELLHRTAVLATVELAKSDRGDYK